MLSIFHKKRINNISKITLKKESLLKPLSKISQINQLNENIKNTSLTLNKKIDNSYKYRTNTVTTENNERLKTNYETVFTNPSLKTKKNFKNNKNIINIFKKNLFYNKKIFRPKTTSKTRYTYKTNKLNYKKINIKNEGVPVNFIKSMRYNLNQHIIKANNFLENEKKKLIKNNPAYKYQLAHEQLVKNKKEELERVNKYKLWKKFLENKDNIYDGNKLNNYYSNLLLRDNHQYFTNPKPIINKKKFYSKYRLLTENNTLIGEVNYKDCINIKNIFSNILDSDIPSKVKNTQKKQIHKIKTKKIIYELIKSRIKKCAIEFKNIIIPLKEYIFFYNYYKNTVENLFSEDYSELIKMIKTAKEEKKIIDFIIKNKNLIYSVNLYGQNLLIIAVKYKLYKTMGKLIQLGINVNLQDFKGRTALYFAVINHDITAVTILLYFLANPSIKDSNNESPLDIAANLEGDKYIIKELLIRSRLIRKINKYRSWKNYDVCIRRGIQYYLIHNLLKEEYHLIFSYIENVILYYS